MTTPAKGVGTILEESFGLFKTNFVPLAMAVGVVLLPLGLLSGGLTLAMTPSASDMGAMRAHGDRLDQQGREYQKRTRELQRTMSEGTDAEKQAASREMAALSQQMASESMAAATAVAAQGAGMVAKLFGYLLFAMLIIPLQMIATFLAQAVVVPMVSASALGGKMDPAAAWKITLSKLVPLIITSLLASLAVGVGLFLCVIPGLVVAFLFSLASPVVMLEGRSGVDALKRSKDLVKRHWVEVLLVLLVYIVLAFCLGLVFAVIGGVVGLVLRQIVMIALFPLPIIMTVLLYLDLRRVDEGIDPTDLHRQF